MLSFFCQDWSEYPKRGIAGKIYLSITSVITNFINKLKAKWFQEGKYASFDMEEKRLKKWLKGSTRMLKVSKK